MNLSFIQSVSSSALCFFREKGEIVLTPQQKKIAVIASLALGCLAALYLVYRCCCFEAEVETEEEDDDFFSLDGSAIKGKEVEKVEYKDGTVVEGFYDTNIGRFKGKKTYFDGKIEEGIFRGQGPIQHLYGKGIITFPNGSIWKGDFLDGELYGKGKKIHHDGVIEEGEFKQSKLDGKGTVTIPGGDIITGFFEKDKLNGYGKVIHPDGSIDEGMFENHVLVKRKPKPTYSTAKVTEEKKEEVATASFE